MFYIYGVYVKGSLVGYRADSMWSIFPIEHAKRYSSNQDHIGRFRLDRMQKDLKFIWKQVPSFSKHSIWNGCQIEDVEIREEIIDSPREPHLETMIVVTPMLKS